MTDALAQPLLSAELEEDLAESPDYECREAVSGEKAQPNQYHYRNHQHSHNCYSHHSDHSHNYDYQ